MSDYPYNAHNGECFACGQKETPGFFAVIGALTVTAGLVMFVMGLAGHLRWI